MGLGREVLAAQHVWRILLHLTPVRGQSVALPHGGCRKQRHGPPRYRRCRPGRTRLSGRRPPRRPCQPSAATALGASSLTPPPGSAWSPSEQAWLGLGWQLIPFAGSCRIPGSDLALAPADVSARRQTRLAAELDLELHQALTASISMIADAGPLAVRKRGSERQGVFPAQLAVRSRGSRTSRLAPLPPFRPSRRDPERRTKPYAFRKWRAGRRVTNKHREESPGRARIILPHAVPRTVAKPAEALC